MNQNEILSKRHAKLENLYVNEVIGYGADAFDPVEEAEELEEFLMELENTTELEMLEALFTCGLEMYGCDEDGEVEDAPICGANISSYFIGKDGQIYDQNDFKVVSAKDFRKMYCPITHVKKAIKAGDYDYIFDFEGEKVAWSIFREMDCYAYCDDFL